MVQASKKSKVLDDDDFLSDSSTSEEEEEFYNNEEGSNNNDIENSYAVRQGNEGFYQEVLLFPTKAKTLSSSSYLEKGSTFSRMSSDLDFQNNEQKETSIPEDIKIEDGKFECELCKTKFGTQEDFESHKDCKQNVQDVDSTFDQKMFEEKEEAHAESVGTFNEYLNKNANAASVEKESLNELAIFKCNFCGKIFRDFYQLHQHKSQKHGNTCLQCLLPFRTQKQLLDHQKAGDCFKTIPTCDFCEFKSKNEEIMRKHLSAKHGQRQEKKRRVGRPRNDSLGELRASYTFERAPESEIRKKRCKLCEYSTSSIFLMRTHYLETHGNKDNGNPSTCQICRKTFLSANYVEKHMRNVHDRPFKTPEMKIQSVCKLCNKVYKSGGAYENHMREVHQFSDTTKKRLEIEDPPAIKCQLCEFQTWSKEAMSLHKIHNHEIGGFGKGPELFCPKCLKTFKVWKPWNKHMERNDCVAFLIPGPSTTTEEKQHENRSPEKA